LKQPKLKPIANDPNRKRARLPAVLVGALLFLSVSQAQAQYHPPTLPEQLKVAEQAVQLAPRDAKKRFELAELLRKTGELRKASIQYLETSLLEPNYYLAYHQMLLCKPSNDQLDESIERLTKLEEQLPKELMLRIALSEVLEQRGETYKAARALVDLQFSEYIPPKYTPQINARVRYLLGKSKDMQMTEKAQQVGQTPTEDLDSVPLPIPESTAAKDLSEAKLKDSRVTEGYGHTKLLP
jgi:tetratricopeptide (TPR) repeat protein